MKILVIGSHGKVGKQVVQQLVNDKHIVHAMIRDKSQASELEQLGAISVVADLEKNFESVFENMDIVVFTAGSGSETGPDKTITVDQEGAIKACDYAQKHQVNHFIMVSAKGAKNPDTASSIQHYYKAKKNADDYLQQTGLNYTIFRPGRLHDEPGNGKIRIAEHVDNGNKTSRENLARLIAKSAGNAKLYGKVLEVFDSAGHDGETDVVNI